MLKFLLFGVSLVFQISIALFMEENGRNLVTEVDGKLIKPDLQPLSHSDFSDGDFFNATFTESQTVVCNETQVCQNGASCLNHACFCLPGTSGPLCEIVNDCVDGKLCKIGRETSCEYDVEQQKAYCDCHIMEWRFDEATRTCRHCLCTPVSSQKLNSFSNCEYKQGQQICSCTEGYAPIYNRYEEGVVCQKCDCGPNSIWCEYDDGGNRVCGCKEGYKQYSVYYGSCEECNCGENGRCSFEGNYRRKCDCDYGYVEHNKICVECRCGKYGECIFDSNGTLTGCECAPGYAEKFSKCEICNCGENSNCSFTGNRKICECQEGFEDVNGFCADVNECEKHSPCNVSSKCVNTLGSFECICAEGYERNQETLLCEDIDECRISKPCSQPHTECINTIGSFKCICESDFDTRGGSESDTFCEKSTSKPIYTLSVSVFLIGSIAAIAIIWHQKSQLRRRRR